MGQPRMKAAKLVRTGALLTFAGLPLLFLHLLAAIVVLAAANTTLIAAMAQAVPRCPGCRRTARVTALVCPRCGGDLER
ncbi:MAG: hypothetical protein LC624_00305 [Halobacteriales archaeon]|nr:hypothetical protein [Halobacteriales archaeon]